VRVVGKKGAGAAVARGALTARLVYAAFRWVIMSIAVICM